jgi:pilus assembly protein CpaE
MVPHAIGLRILQSPLSPEQSEFITADHVRHILQVMASSFDYIIVDCQANYEERILTILEMADDVFFIATPEIHVLKNSVSFFELMARMNVSSDKFHILLNRADSNQALQRGEIEKALKHKISFEVRSDGRALLQSANRGIPLVLHQPHHPISLELFKIADSFLRLPQVSTVKPAEEKRNAKGRNFRPKVLAAARS